jgi:hypothetical protein
MSKHLNEAPPSARVQVPEVPEALDQVIMRSLAKPIGERYQSAADMQAALEACVAGVPMERLSIAPSSPVGLPAAPPRSQMTGLASRLEPAIREGGKKNRATLWLVLGAIVLAGSAGAIVAMKKTGGASAQAGGTPATTGEGRAARPDGAPALAASDWPEPLQPDGLRFDVDKRFESPEAVRVLSARQRDAAHVARSYVAARSRFIEFADKQKLGVPVEVHPLNLAIVPARVLCDPRLYAPEPPSDKCADLGFFYEPRTRTLFVTDDASTELVSIPEGAAVHLCRTTPALHQKGCGSTLLTPYFDEIERDL